MTAEYETDDGRFFEVEYEGDTEEIPGSPWSGGHSYSVAEIHSVKEYRWFDDGVRETIEIDVNAPENKELIDEISKYCKECLDDWGCE
jgi:hypothetical protein